MLEITKDPAIKLFGKQIPFQPKAENPADPSQDPPASELNSLEEEGDEDLTEEEEKDAQEENEMEALQQDPALDEEDRSMNLETSVNPKTPSINEQTAQSKDCETEKEQSESPDSQQQNKTIKKPDKILPCPRCNSMDTKFCYYNNYNVNQPRHFCKACQRYWTAGGTMRNVPVGAGRRKCKNSSSSHYRHITISEALQAASIDSQKSNARVLSFNLDRPICDSMTSVLNLREKKVLNGTRNGVHRTDHESLQVEAKGGENGDDGCSASSVTVSNSREEKRGGEKICLQEPLVQNNVTPFPPQIPCLPGVPWPYPTFSSSGAPMLFYPPPPPAAYWNCIVPGTWSFPWLAPQQSSSSCPNSPKLGKHSRDDGDVFKPDNTEKPKEKTQNGRVLVPKTLRIDDPSEAAKSSIWKTLGIKNESISGGMFQPKGNEKKKTNHLAETPPSLLANPAALCRSLNFHENS